MRSLKLAISTLISISILGVQLTPGYGAIIITKEEIPRVAFIGIHFNGVDSNKQSIIRSQISDLIRNEEQLYSISEQKISNTFSTDIRANITKKLRREDLQDAAKQLDADYIFAGNIQNQSKSEDVTALTGKIVRYDHSTDQLFELGIKTFYENFATELTRIDQQLIQTLTGPKKKRFFARYLPGIVIVVATVAAAALLFGGTSGQGSGDNGGQRPPFTVH